MAVNDLTFNQLSTLLNSIQEQATGKSGMVATNSNEFVTIGQMVLKTGYDTTLNAISQVLTRTLFRVRPYSAKFKGLMVSNQRFGNVTRKLSIADKDFEDDDRQGKADGVSVDQYTINKPNVYELNFYGANLYQKSITIYKDQLDQAFNSVEEFGSFISMVMQNISDQMEHARENLARATVANFIAGKVEAGNNVIHLLTEYNTLTGLALTKADIYKPENYKDFVQWVSSRIMELSSLMTERSQKFHLNIVGKEVSRHTPMNKQKVYLHAPWKFGTEARVLADTFHDNYIKLADSEVVNFWQSIDTPDEINVKSTYLVEADGTLATAPAAVNTTDVFGVMFDEETLGMTLVNQWSSPTPFNAKGGYSNIFFHETARYWIDYTENGIVMLLD